MAYQEEKESLNMKDFDKLINICLEEIKAVGIKPGKIIKWSINTRAKSRWGYCIHKKIDNTYEIQIAEILLSDDRVSEEACKTTIIHEILHTCEGGMGHKGNWKKYANIMNERYGYNIKCSTSGEEKGVENRVAAYRLAYKYYFYCRKCGHIIKKKKSCKFTSYYRNYTCNLCGTRRAFVKK